MPNYYIDTEFHEGFHKPLFGRRRHFIDLISIAIVNEQDEHYYAICKDFDVKAAWNSWQPGKGQLTNFGMEKRYPREYWLRENVLRPIFDKFYPANLIHLHFAPEFNYRNFKRLIDAVGLSREQIKNGMFEFICPYEKASEYADVFSIDSGAEGYLQQNPPVFYGYYADYDWVAFCSLFGKMINLPSGFPMYMRDLKQMLDELCELIYPGKTYWHKADKPDDLNDRLAWVKARPDYPKQVNEHSALHDARWNKELHLYLQKLWVSGGR